jgi:hypothetical protein
MSKFKEELLKFKNKRKEREIEEQDRKNALFCEVSGKLEKMKFEDFSENGEIDIQIGITTKNLDVLNDEGFYDWLSEKLKEKFGAEFTCQRHLPFGIRIIL